MKKAKVIIISIIVGVILLIDIFAVVFIVDIFKTPSSPNLETVYNGAKKNSIDFNLRGYTMATPYGDKFYIVKFSPKDLKVSINKGKSSEADINNKKYTNKRFIKLSIGI